MLHIDHNRQTFTLETQEQIKLTHRYFDKFTMDQPVIHDRLYASSFLGFCGPLLVVLSNRKHRHSARRLQLDRMHEKLKDPLVVVSQPDGGPERIIYVRDIACMFNTSISGKTLTLVVLQCEVVPEKI